MVSLYYFTTYSHYNYTQIMPYSESGNTPHIDASRKVKEKIFGCCIAEVIAGKHYFGRELSSKTKVLSYNDFLNKNHCYDTVILHILYGSQLAKDIDRKKFFKILLHARMCGKRVIILEHNSDSLDFSGKSNVFNIGDLIDFVREIWRNDGEIGVFMNLESSKGLNDNKRNIILAIDTRKIKTQIDRFSDRWFDRWRFIRSNLGTWENFKRTKHCLKHPIWTLKKWTEIIRKIIFDILGNIF